MINNFLLHDSWININGVILPLTYEYYLLLIFVATVAWRFLPMLIRYATLGLQIWLEFFERWLSLSILIRFLLPFYITFICLVSLAFGFVWFLGGLVAFFSYLDFSSLVCSSTFLFYFYLFWCWVPSRDLVLSRLLTFKITFGLVYFPLVLYVAFCGLGENPLLTLFFYSLPFSLIFRASATVFSGFSFAVIPWGFFSETASVFPKAVHHHVSAYGEISKKILKALPTASGADWPRSLHTYLADKGNYDALKPETKILLDSISIFMVDKRLDHLKNITSQDLNSIFAARISCNGGRAKQLFNSLSLAHILVNSSTPEEAARQIDAVAVKALEETRDFDKVVTYIKGNYAKLSSEFVVQPQNFVEIDFLKRFTLALPDALVGTQFSVESFGIPEALKTKLDGGVTLRDATDPTKTIHVGIEVKTAAEAPLKISTKADLELHFELHIKRLLEGDLGKQLENHFKAMADANLSGDFIYLLFQGFVPTGTKVEFNTESFNFLKVRAKVIGGIERKIIVVFSAADTAPVDQFPILWPKGNAVETARNSTGTPKVPRHGFYTMAKQSAYDPDTYFKPRTSLAPLNSDNLKHGVKPTPENPESLD